MNLTNAPSSDKLAVLFADISGSTALYEKLGDDLARQLIAESIALLCSTLPQQQGVLIKTLGDEVMCTFPSAEQALHAACDMQRLLKTTHFQGKYQLSARIGFHFGEVIHEANDIYGDTVNVAARIAAMTRARQIMTSQAVAENLPASIRAGLRQLMRAEFKGKQERLDIFQVIWEQDDVAITRTRMPDYRHASTPPGELTLNYVRQTVRVDQSKRSVMLGRNHQCELTVTNDFVSRLHARVELRADRFMLIDQSTNGTYLLPERGDMRHLIHEETPLTGSGFISLGNSDCNNHSELIAYRVASPA